MTIRDPAVYGYLAEFNSPEQLLAAAKATHAAGYRRLDAFTPFPIHGLSDAVGFHHTRLPLIVLLGGLFGMVGTFMLQYVYETQHYPMNIGGRPHNSWPAFIVPMFEGTVLCAALSAVLGMLALNGLPQPFHPLFNVPQFELASRSHFFLVIKAPDPQFDLDRTRQFLESLGPISVALVPNAPPKRKVTSADLGAPPTYAAPPVPHARAPGAATRTTLASPPSTPSCRWTPSAPSPSWSASWRGATGARRSCGRRPSSWCRTRGRRRPRRS